MRRLTMWMCIMLVTIGGCAGERERLTAATESVEYGISPVGGTAPLWLSAGRPGLSAAGRDFLFVGPMSVNRNGSSERYLWFGLSTTIDRDLTGAPPLVTESVILVVDGTPMNFDLVEWDAGPSASAYVLPVDGFASYAARVTASQLRQVAQATRVDAYVTNREGRSPVFTLVEGDAAVWLRL